MTARMVVTLALSVLGSVLIGHGTHWTTGLGSFILFQLFEYRTGKLGKEIERGLNQTIRIIQR